MTGTTIAAMRMPVELSEWGEIGGPVLLSVGFDGGSEITIPGGGGGGGGGDGGDGVLSTSAPAPEA
jgi:hypothetical protein